MSPRVSHAQVRLWANASRSCAVAVGRGAFTLATVQPLPTEPVTLPKLNLSGRLPSQHDATLNLDLAAMGAPPDVTVWPEFHTGCATGLRLFGPQAQLTRNWIEFHRGSEASPAHSGLLLAFGLGGHLRALSPHDWHMYLTLHHEPTTIAVLLGCAASRVGSGDSMTSRMLFLHLPSRHPSSYPEVALSAPVQSAALVSVGLLYQGTGNRLMAEIALGEISRKLSGESVAEREGYSLSAGLALGLIALGRGRSSPTLADIRIEERCAKLARFALC